MDKDRCVDDCPICGGCGSVGTTTYDLILDDYVEIQCPVKGGDMTLEQAKKTAVVEWPDEAA